MCYLALMGDLAINKRAVNKHGNTIEPCVRALNGAAVFYNLQVDTEKWDTVYQPISSREETVEIYLDEVDPIANLEAVARSGTGKRRPRVRVDLAGAEFFHMEEVAVEFAAEKSGGSHASSRTQLGYRTTEEVWLFRGRVLCGGLVL